MPGYLFLVFVFASLSTISADLYYGPDTEESHKEDDGDFVGRRHGESLSKFIARVIAPNKEYLQKCGRTIDKVADLMKSKMVLYKVGKTIKHDLKSYAAELLVIKTYEDLGFPSSIREEDLAINVFEKLTDLKTLKVSWSIYFDPNNCNAHSAPYILDPAYPYHNVID